MKTTLQTLIVLFCIAFSICLYANESSVFYGGHGGCGGGGHGGGGHSGGGHCGGGHGGGHCASSGYCGGGHGGGGHSDGASGCYHFCHNVNEHQGTIILKSCDTLKGFITLGWKCDLWMVTDSSDEGSFIPYSDIEKVRLYNDCSDLYNTDYTDFTTLNFSNRIFRVIYDGTFSLYDTVLCAGVQESNLKLVPGFYVRENGTLKYLYYYSFDNKGMLKQFINEHYGLKMRRRDFKNATSALKFIIDNG